jgi:uncharacterized protein YkwD
LSLLWILMACGTRSTPVAEPEVVPMVRSRPTTLAPDFAQDLVARVPGGQWDQSLAQSVSILTAHARDPGARIPPRQAQDARALAGYPCPASFVRELTGSGAQPERLIEELASLALVSTVPVDVAFARRDFDNGSTLWVAGICPSMALLDPVPRDLSLGDPIPTSVEPLAKGWDLVLYIDPPDRRIVELPLKANVAQWFTATNLPGEYRFEVVGTQGKDSRVLLLWSVFVDVPPPEPTSLPRASTTPQDPMAAADALFLSLNALREDAGLAPVQRFEPFEPLAREQAATMAWRGQVGHVLAGVPTLADRAEAGFRPRAEIYENLAAAPSWEEAHDLVALSPGHARNLLCETCTHTSIGVALEPTLGRMPRLFVAWELLAFPDGEPQPIRAQYPREIR